MALNFQGDRAVGVLNDPKNTFNTDDLFRVYDGGILVAGGISVDHGDFVSWDGTKWKLEADIKIANSNEVAEAEAEAAQISDGGAKTESDLVDGALSIGDPNSITVLTLTTAQALTVLANDGVPNFALEIDNTGNSNDVTVAVKDSAGTATLKASAAGGDTIGTGKYMQLTCVGNCWTLAEFTVPTP